MYARRGDDHLLSTPAPWGRFPRHPDTGERGTALACGRPASGSIGRNRQPSMRWVVQNDVRSVLVAAWAAALNSAVVETPYQCELA